MFTFPTLNQAKAHSKYLSQVIGIKRTHAQEIVAFIHKQNTWAELVMLCKDLGGTLLSDNSHFPTLYCSQETIARFDSVISKYRKAIDDIIAVSPKVHDSLLTRISNKDYHRISGSIVGSLLDEIEGYESYRSSTAENVLFCLNFWDDSVFKAIYNRNTKCNNPTLSPEFLPQHFYAYYNFKGKSVDISCREWDLNLERPSKLKRSSNAVDERSFQESICTRKWFKPYMIGYLKMICQHFRMAGFSGNIRIHKILNYSANNHKTGIRDDYYHDEIAGLFDALIKLGGRYVREKGAGGELLDIDCLEISFFADGTNQWMIGESTI